MTPDPTTVRPEPVEASPERLPVAGSRRGLPSSSKEVLGFDKLSPNGFLSFCPDFPGIDAPTQLEVLA